MYELRTFFLIISYAALSWADYNCSPVENVKVTFYGFPDNSPPGAAIMCDINYRGDCDVTTTNTCMNTASKLLTAANCGPRGQTAGGTGTYDDPLTMASAGNWFCHLEVVYLPYLQKYLRYEDYCQQCIVDVPTGIHIDIWTGSNKTNGGSLQLQCENFLTPGSLQTMIRDPASDLPVDTTSLFSPNGANSLCNNTLPASYGGSSSGTTSGGMVLQTVIIKLWISCILLSFLIR